MATVQIADKSTLDNVATNVTYIKNNMPSGGGGTPKIAIINTDSQYTGVTFTVSNEDFGFSQSVTMSGTKAEVEVPYLGEYTVSAPITGSFLVNRSVNVTTAVTIIYDPDFVEIKSFGSCTDAELEQILNAHYADAIDISDYWAVGDTRTIHLDAMQAPNPNSGNTWLAQDIVVTIVAINHTDLATPINGHTKAAITVQTREVLSGISAGTTGTIHVNGDSSKDTTFTKWSNLYMRTYLNDKVWEAFPSTFKAAIKPSSHYRHTNYNTSTSEQVTDNLFLPSYPEIYGTASYSNYVATSPVEGTQFSYYQTSTNRVKYPNNNGVAGNSATYWWMGSASSFYSSTNGYYWCYVGTDGSTANNRGALASGLAPAFAM